MTSYAHTQFTARNAKQFRAGLLNAINHDLKIDAESGEPNLSKDGIVRHGVWVNGRHIGYEAAIDDAGNLLVTNIQCLRARPVKYKMRSLDKLRQEAEAIRTCRAFLGM